MAQAKTYVLLQHMHPTAPIYRQINANTRVRLDKRISHTAYLQLSVTDPEGNNEVLRLKLNSNSLLQREQMEKGIPANEKFTDAERKAVKFVYGVNVTTNATVQKFLDTTPENILSSWKAIDDDISPVFTVYDKDAEIKSENQAFRDRLKAANKIANLNLQQAKELLLGIYGSAYTLPEASNDELRLEAYVNVLIDYLDESDDSVKEILKVRGNVDEDIRVLVGKAVNYGILSFDVIQGSVAVKRAGQWQAMKEIDATLSPDQRHTLFGQYLATEGGKLQQQDLRDLVKEQEDILNSGGSGDNGTESNKQTQSGTQGENTQKGSNKNKQQ